MKVFDVSLSICKHDVQRPGNRHGCFLPQDLSNVCDFAAMLVVNNLEAVRLILLNFID